MIRLVLNLAAAVSLLLCVAVIIFWIRGQSGTDQLSWTYDRYLPDRSAASTQLFLTSDRPRLWLLLTWGHVGPYNGQLVWGYYVNADQSGGQPRFGFHRDRYDRMDTWALPYDADQGASGWGPLRWQTDRRSPPKDGDESRSIRIGMSYWLLSLILLALPTQRVNRFRKLRRARKIGLCRTCGYDLRATTACCPECGTIPLT